MEIANLRRKYCKISRNGNKKEATGKRNTDDQIISLQARKFCVMNENFVPEAAFLTAYPNFNPVSPDHYSSEDFIRKGIIAELFEQVPVNLHEKNARIWGFSRFGKLQSFPIITLLILIDDTCI